MESGAKKSGISTALLPTAEKIVTKKITKLLKKSYIEKIKHIHKLFFVIFACLLPCNFEAYCFKKFYYR